ncbi:MAG: hypothetical protein H7Y39_03430, partial [Nitrospiraceae bacterium]|nr:hypothetical protein [Nitrospiraceae bacterium]
MINDRLHLVSGMIQSAGALVFQDPHLAVTTAQHDILELKFFEPPKAAARGGAGAPSAGGKKTYTRYNVNSPEVATVLGRAPSTLSRESARNATRGRPYRACTA